MAEIINEEKASFLQSQAEVMKSLRKAFEMDAERGKLIGDKAENDPTPNKHKKAWFKINWPSVVVWFVALLFVWFAITPKQKPKRSHHKYDENGRLIY